MASNKRSHDGAESDFSMKDPSSSECVADVLSPRKTARYDFFADLKKRKEGDKVVKIGDLSLGKNFTQEIKFVTTWKLRNPENYFSFQGYDGENVIIFKVFSRAMSQFFDKVQEFQAYKIRNFLVAKVDEKFRTQLDGTYEIILSSESNLEPIDDQIPIPFEPISLANVLETEAGAIIDVVGIFVFAEEARKTSTNKLVRECSMIDQSEKTVSVYFWEKDAENFQLPLKVPIGLRKVQVKDYGNEKVLWFQRISAADTINVDSDGKLIGWFNELTAGLMF